MDRIKLKFPDWYARSVRLRGSRASLASREPSVFLLPDYFTEMKVFSTCDYRNALCSY